MAGLKIIQYYCNAISQLIDLWNLEDQYIPATTTVHFISAIWYKNNQCLSGTCHRHRVHQETSEFYNEHRRTIFSWLQLLRWWSMVNSWSLVIKSIKFVTVLWFTSREEQLSRSSSKFSGVPRCGRSKSKHKHLFQINFWSIIHGIECKAWVDHRVADRLMEDTFWKNLANKVVTKVKWTVCPL